jgi:hypothetical protein
MVAPTMQSGTEKWNELPSFGIVNVDTVRLAQIAAGARPRQILQARIAAARAWNDMLDVKGRSL